MRPCEKARGMTEAGMKKFFKVGGLGWSSVLVQAYPGVEQAFPALAFMNFLRLKLQCD